MDKKKLLILCFSLLLTACNNTISTHKEMLKIIKQEENISADTEIKECGSVVDNNKILIISMTGEYEQVYNYYIAEFQITENKEYQFVKTYPSYNMGWLK